MYRRLRLLTWGLVGKNPLACGSHMPSLRQECQSVAAWLRVLEGQSATTELTGLTTPPGMDPNMLDLVRSEILGGNYDLNAIRTAGAVVLDCGAHIGLFSRWALTKGVARIISIEPSPATRVCLEHNLAAEIASGRCTIVPVALSDCAGRCEFSTSDQRNPGSHHLLPNASGGELTVAVDSIDAIVDSLGLERLDFIKMDIEGAEVAALRGAAATIRRFRPVLAIASEHTADQMANARAVIATVREIDAGYDWRATCVRPQRDAGAQRRLVPQVLQFAVAARGGGKMVRADAQ